MDVILQARFNSRRLPGKILLNFDKVTFLEFLIKNLKKSKNIDKIIIASPHDKYRKIFKKISQDCKIYFFSKKSISSSDVLSRYYECSKIYNSKNIIRITTDCPFINYNIVDLMIKKYNEKKLNFLTNNKPRYVPHGFDCEIINVNLLNNCHNNASSKYDREHVTPWIYKNYFTEKINNIRILNNDFSKKRLTLDYPDDYLNFINQKKILVKISQNKNFLKFLKKYSNYY